MMKRVYNSRFAVTAMLLAVVLLSAGGQAPVWASEQIAIGQSGDPNDGNDVESGGSNSRSQDSLNQSDAVNTSSHLHVLLVPVNVAGIMFFRVVLVPTLRNAK